MRILTRMRNADFIGRCIETARRERKRGTEPGTRRIVALTVYGPAGGYYITYKRALTIVKRYMATPPEKREPIVKETPAQARARNLAEETQEAMAHYGITLEKAVTHVMGKARARRFYFSVDYGMKLFSQLTARSTRYDSGI